MNRALWAALAVIVSSIMYLPAAESASPATAPPLVIHTGLSACPSLPADTVAAPSEFSAASIEFGISK